MLFLSHSANYGSDKKKENHSHYKNNTEALLDKLISKTKEKKYEYDNRNNRYDKRYFLYRFGATVVFATRW